MEEIKIATHDKDAREKKVKEEKEKQEEDQQDKDDGLVAQLESLSLERKTPRRLIVLDLNGLLIFRVFSRDKRKFTQYLDSSVKVNDFFVWKRPHVESFLDWLLERFSVAIWSSAMQHNVEALIEWTLGKERRGRLAFEWDQSRCPQEKHPTHSHKPLFLKPLQDVWTQYPTWNESNTLLVDDSPLKAKRNPPNLLFR